MENLIFLLIILIVIYFIFKRLIKGSFLLLLCFFIFLWFLLNSSYRKKEMFNTYINLGKKRNSSSITNYLYDDTAKVYTSTNYYNCPNCTLDTKCSSCIIPPDTNNLFPPNLRSLALNTSTDYQCNKGLIDFPKCSNSM